MDTIDNLVYERELLSRGVALIGGSDEVGRGPLAGNVVCAAVIMPMDDIIVGITDSKKLSESKREKLYDIIMSKAIAVSICQRSPERIDEINILNATKECMREAILSLNPLPQTVLIDALQLDLPMDTLPIIKGDLKSYTIGAASIVAKVYRDRQMKDYASVYPQYGFEKHKGYGTAEHIAAIAQYGICPIHRKSFVKNFV